MAKTCISRYVGSKRIDRVLSNGFTDASKMYQQPVQDVELLPTPRVKVVDEMCVILFPPVPGACQECAFAHDPEYPHNRDSLYYQMKFRKKNGRFPTWNDAMAHCSDSMKAESRDELARRGIDVEEPATDGQQWLD